MERNELIQEIERLQSQLATTEDLDEGTRQQLVELADEIREFAQEEGEARPAPLTMKERLAELTLEIESHHPVQTEVVNQITLFLSRIGI